MRGSPQPYDTHNVRSDDRAPTGSAPVPSATRPTENAMTDAETAPLAVKQVARGRRAHADLRPGATTEVHTSNTVVFGRLVLLASESGSYFDALGVVIGQPGHLKVRQHRREVLVTDRLPQSSVRLRRACPTTERVCTTAEYREAIDRAARSTYAFVREASEVVSDDLGGAKQTEEGRCARFLVECANRLRGFAGDTEVPVAATKGSTRTYVRHARADALIRVPDRAGRKAVLVVETEWSAPGGAELAAQAWEYAARLKRMGGFADGVSRLRFTTTDLERATLWPVVVADNLPEVSLAAEHLGVTRMRYPDFLAMLRSGSFHRLTPLGD